jgi:hypothetical protein
LLLLLGDLLARFRRLIDQRGGLAVLVVLVGQGEPDAGHSEKANLDFPVLTLLGKPDALSGL